MIVSIHEVSVQRLLVEFGLQRACHPSCRQGSGVAYIFQECAIGCSEVIICCGALLASRFVDASFMADAAR